MIFKKILITGGAGFIGSALIRYIINIAHSVVNVDKLTYAGNLESFQIIEKHSRYKFEKVENSMTRTKLLQFIITQMKYNAVGMSLLTTYLNLLS